MNNKNEGLIVTQRRLIRDLATEYNRSNIVSYWGVYYPIMPENKIFRFLRQFPWVLGFIQERDIAQVYVSGLDPLVITSPLGEEHPDIGFAHEYAFLLDKDGSVVSATSEETRTNRKFLFFGPKITKKEKVFVRGTLENGQNISSMLTLLGSEQTSKIMFIMSYDSWTKTVIIYKRPHNLTFDQWIKGETCPEDAETAVMI